MNEEQRKVILRETFDTVSAGYDSEALRFFPESARLLVSLLDLQGNEQVLDVATGTGHAALALAARVPRGRVTAVDFSPGMLEQARGKSAAMGIRNVEFLERDMQELGFLAGSFDAAVCAFGIFFAADMDAQLAHITGMVRPGGRVAITSFQEGYFQPLRDLLFKRLEGNNVRQPPQAWKRITTTEGCKEFFRTAGLENLHVIEKNVGYFLRGPEEWWDVVSKAGFRRLVAQVAPSEQEQFRREHLQEISVLATRDGIWLDVGVLFTIGTKPDGRSFPRRSSGPKERSLSSSS